jgi:hypothetical protein
MMPRMATAISRAGSKAMTDTAGYRDEAERDPFSLDISDAALEAAAIAVPGAAMSFPNAPTVSILVVCCGNDQ